MNEPEEQDTYVSQLREVFESCDSQGNGYLSRDELVLLCHKLQLTDQINIFVYQLLGDEPNAKVGFEEFKDAFVSLLTESVGMGEIVGAENEENIENNHNTGAADREVSPKFILGTKKYGRRSRPVFDENGTPPDFSDNELLCVPLDGAPSLLQAPSNTKFRSPRDNDQDSKSCGKMEYSYTSPLRSNGTTTPLPIVRVSSERNISETFESGTSPQLGVPMESDNSMESNPEEYLHGIWKKLGVGKDGYLNLEELARVCEHIGMDMSDEVVTQLFEKLDCDQDGKVSFEEFLQGLFQHGGPQLEVTEIQISDSPVHKDKFYKEDSQDDHQMAAVSTESGIFCSIDPENTGYAEASTISELWENLGLSGGMRLLKDLGFNTNMKINLLNLTSMLEDELTSTTNGSTLYQFAVLTYQNELRHIKLNYDQAFAEREKLRVGIAEANARAALLAQEVDDHHAKLEKSSQNKLLFLEKKYQDQVRELQDELQRERDILAAQTNRIKQQFQSEMDAIREEEGKLKSRLIALEQENIRLEQELTVATEKCMEAERLKEVQQRELESMVEMKQRLAELESGCGLLREQHYQSLLQEMESNKKQNKELQDHIDELTLEVENLRQQLANSNRPQGKRHRPTGSWLSDYTKDSNSLKRRGSGSSSDDNSDEDSPVVGKVRRRILLLPREDQNRVPFEVEKLKEHHKEEVDRLRSEYEKTVKDIEALYQNRVTELESQLECHFLSQPEVDRDQGDGQDSSQREDLSPMISCQMEEESVKSNEQLTYEMEKREQLLFQKEQSMMQLKQEMESLLMSTDEKLKEQVQANSTLQKTLVQQKEDMERCLKEEKENAKRILEEECERCVAEARQKAYQQAKEDFKREMQLVSNFNTDDAAIQVRNDLQTIFQSATRQNGENGGYNTCLQQDVEELLTRTLRNVEVRLEKNHLQEQERVKQHWEEEMNELRQQQVMDRLETELKHKEELRTLLKTPVALPQEMEPTKSDILLKDLYLENSRLHRELQTAEERQQRAEQSSTRLQYKCKVLSKLLTDITRAAMS